MMKYLIATLALALIPARAFAVDGQVLINQSTVMAAGGFPYTISQSGSYKLSGNLLVPSGVSGIVITAANVTLDLNGFSIVTPLQPTSGLGVTSSIGVNFGPSESPVTVRNGVIRGFLLPAGYAFVGFAVQGAFELALPPNTVLEDLDLIWDGSTNFVTGIAVSYFGRLTRVNAGGFGLLLGGLFDTQRTPSCPSLVESSVFNELIGVQPGCVTVNVADIATVP